VKSQFFHEKIADDILKLFDSHTIYTMLMLPIIRRHFEVFPLDKKLKEEMNF